MIFVDGEYRDGAISIGPWTTDQEIEALAKRSRTANTTPQTLTDLRTACREHLARADASYRPPLTIQ